MRLKRLTGVALGDKAQLGPSGRYSQVPIDKKAGGGIKKK